MPSMLIFPPVMLALLGDLSVDFFNTKKGLLSDSINLLQLRNLLESPTRITATSSTLIDAMLVTAPLFSPKLHLWIQMD